MTKFDCIVVGAGHAGIEASHAAARMGCATLLVTLSRDAIGKLSCNPAVGGVSKGHLVRETDALGGLIARCADASAISYRILNRSKGKAVWATRAQVDMQQYPRIARKHLEDTKLLEILQARVLRIVTLHNKVCGIETDLGRFVSKTVIIAAGTFLKSTIHIGLTHFPGGRLSESSSDELFASIRALKIPTRHFKTGTCARLDKRSIDFSKMEEQRPDEDAQPFSLLTRRLPGNLLSCFITHTNKKTHRIILDNLSCSPLYTGVIKARGVRYCPSLEDKIVKFKDHHRHQIFIEPEGRDTLEVYPNGISTSLPFDIQQKFIHSIAGLERAIVLRPGYGIEHGTIDTRQLHATLESKRIKGLYFAGQVNGTTGYEEAAAQGIVAGINAACLVKRKKPFVLRRESSFIGVLIDDLVSKGTDEPYRMFTSRSEFRLSLRETNADLRLAPLGFELGLLDKEAFEVVRSRKDALSHTLSDFKTRTLVWLGKTTRVAQLLRQPNIGYESIESALETKVDDVEVQREAEIEIKYETFLRREQVWRKELKNLDRIRIPKLDFSKIPSLSREVIEKLTALKPSNLGDALRISGITPAAIVTVYNYLIQKNRSKAKQKPSGSSRHVNK